MAANLNAINLVLEVPGGTQELYDKTNGILQLEKVLPEGLISHCAGPMPGGWRVCDVWESQEHFNDFFTKRLFPAFQQLTSPQAIRSVYPITHYIQPEIFTATGQGTVGGAVNAIFVIPGG